MAASRGAWRIVDETYLDLADREPDGTEVKSVLACDPDAIVCNSFSKFFGMTGWRLGWAILPDEPTVLEAVDDLATNYYLCAPHAHATCGARLLHAGKLGGMRSSSSGIAGPSPHCD